MNKIEQLETLSQTLSKKKVKKCFWIETYTPDLIRVKVQVSRKKMMKIFPQALMKQWLGSIETQLWVKVWSRQMKKLSILSLSQN